MTTGRSWSKAGIQALHHSTTRNRRVINRKSTSTNELLKTSSAFIKNMKGKKTKQTSSKELLIHGRQIPLWSLSSHLWFPQDNILPHTRSHSCNPPCSKLPRPPSSTRRLRLFLPILAKEARGQQILLHWCRPQARRAAHGLSHKISFSSMLETAELDGLYAS